MNQNSLRSSLSTWKSKTRKEHKQTLHQTNQVKKMMRRRKTINGLLKLREQIQTGTSALTKREISIITMRRQTNWLRPSTRNAKMEQKNSGKSTESRKERIMSFVETARPPARGCRKI
jgi:hypothetical protein